MRSGSRTTTAKSASLLFNNLASSRQYTGYVHYNCAVIVPDSSIATGGGNSAPCAFVKEPDDAQIQQVRWVPLHAGDLFVVASLRSLQLYTADGGRLLHVVTAGVPEGDPPASYRGIASCATAQTEYVCGGCSTGSVCLIPLAPGGGHTFIDPLLCPASQHEIVDLAAGPAPHLDPDRALVCSADGAGDVHVHALEADGSWGHCVSFHYDTSDGTPSLVTSLRMRGHRLYCAHSTGIVRIYDLVSCTVSCSVTAHARWINALEVHPTREDLFVTAAEDATIGLWSISEPSGKLSHVSTTTVLRATPVPEASRLNQAVTPAITCTLPVITCTCTPHTHLCPHQVADWLLTGVSFAGGQERTHVVTSAYDNAALIAYRLD